MKGRRLISPKKGDLLLRPTTDYVKESLFNILGDRCKEARVLDLFSGTGSLSIEAFSRGASYVEAVEKRKVSLQILYKNLNFLKIKDQIQVISMDVFKYLRHYKKKSFDIILIDPPFKKKLLILLWRAYQRAWFVIKALSLLLNLVQEKK